MPHHNVQSEEADNILPKRYKLVALVLFIATDGDAVNPNETIDVPRDAGLLPNLTTKELHS